MEHQTYENSYRVRNHWHFIDSLTPKKASAPLKNTPTNKQKNRQSPQGPHRSPFQNQPTVKPSDKQFVSRIKKEKEKHIGKQLAESRKAKPIQIYSDQEEQQQHYQSNRKRRLPNLIAKSRNSPQGSNKLQKQPQPTAKTPILRQKVSQMNLNPKRKQPQSVHLQQSPPPIQRARYHAKQRSKSMGQEYLNSPLEKYLYLSIEDERKIAQIHKKIKCLRIMDSPK